MKITEHLANTNGKTLFSFEVLPPLRGQSISSINETIRPLMQFEPAFINVTYHREDYVYKRRNNGVLQKQIIRKRPGTVGICAAIINKFKVDAVPHIICGGFTKDETEYALIDLAFLGVDNILVIRGDAIKSEGKFTPDPDGHAHALGLLNQVVKLNEGYFLNSDKQDSFQSDFSIGVAGYPEKHFEAPDFDTDVKYLKAKVDAGAGYIITQMFFDNNKFFEFVNECRLVGIKVPIIPGLKPITTKRQMTLLPDVFQVSLPDELVNQLNACQSENEIKEVGINWCIQQSKELNEYGVPSLHYYTMSKAEATLQIAKEVF